ncbi:MAG: DUF1631 family protein [Pseudohongiellaceae bacterium]
MLKKTQNLSGDEAAPELSYAADQLRWSLGQCTRERIQHLCSDLFDEVDDFIFTAGQKGQFGEIANYLQAMREIRSNRQKFEDFFLAGFEVNFLTDGPELNTDVRNTENATAVGTKKIVPEQTELELALTSMRRKALRLYFPQIKQLAHFFNTSTYYRGAISIQEDFLVRNVISAFESAHTLFELPMDVKLILFKLFEKHLLLKLEPVFLDCKNIIGNTNHRKTGLDAEIVEPVDAAISDAGKKIINDQDLNEIVTLLSDKGRAADGDEQISEADTIAHHLKVVDSLPNGTALIYRSGQQEQVCVLQKSRTVENSYALNNRHGRLLLTRSRIGLAISMRAGELQTPEAYIGSCPNEVGILETLSGSGFGITIQ